MYDGIPQALGAIRGGQRGCKMAVLSNKPVAPSRAIVESLGLGKFFVSVYGGNSFATKKPIRWERRPFSGRPGPRPNKLSLSETLVWTLPRAATLAYGPAASPTGSHPTHWKPIRPDVVVDNAKELARMFRSPSSS